MPIVAMPEQTLSRLRDRLDDLSKRVALQVFAADTKVPALIFTSSETAAFGGDNGAAMVVAVPELDALENAIPASEDGRLNYIILDHPRAIARLDPFT
ncbi:hypothetical protein [Yoonia sp. SS1-5]|uniref:Uncharacterized protein n=1 Tax=Yoonia rhodophyticola TaxID=3137370 RepID=A0AAN0MCK5_9RHOB